MVSYYVKKLTEKTTGKSVYQLHGNCYVNDMNVAGFSKTVVNKNACQIALYQTGTIKDAMSLQTSWALGGTPANTWACVDKFAVANTYSTDDKKMHSNNCMMNPEKSTVTTDTTTNLANIKYHFHRDFVVASSTQDLALSVGQTYKVNVYINGLGQQGAAFKGWSGEGEMVLVEPSNDPNKAGARALGVSVLVSLVALVMA